MRVSRLSIDFIPPSQADEPSSGDIFQIVEIHCEQDDGDDEDHDEVGCEEHAEEVDEETGCGGMEGRLRSIVSLQVVWEKREREREGGIGVPIRKERKVKRVMGCALSRQLSWPGVGLMSAMAGSVRAMRWVLGLSTGIDTDGMFTIVRHVGERTRFVKSPVSAGVFGASRA